MAMNQTPISPPARITHVVPEGALIKIYGVTDDSTINIVDKILEGYTEKLRRGDEGKARSPADVAPGNIVLVPHFGKYRRAEVIQVGELGKHVFVRLIDIGGVTSCQIYDVRIVEATTHLNFSRVREGPAPVEYFLANVLKPTPWTPEITEKVNAICSIPSERLQCSLMCIIAGRALINVHYASYNGQGFLNFANFLVGENFGTIVNLDQMKMEIHSLTEEPTISHHQFQMPVTQMPTLAAPPGLTRYNPQPTLTNNFIYPQQQQPVLPTPTSYPSYGMRPSLTTSIGPSMTSYTRLRGPRPIHPQPSKVENSIPQNFIADTLPVGSEHEVYVSHVIDGMLNFTVQIKVFIRPFVYHVRYTFI